jgi:REP element-mobilizing transposase RayT
MARMIRQPRYYYHVTLQPYKRLPLLYDEVEAYLRGALPRLAYKDEFNLLEVGVVPTHIHLLLTKAPWANLLKIIQRIQSETSEQILIRFPELGQSFGIERFWADGFHYTKHTAKSLETVRQYVRDQKKHHGLE